jgi:hypothetical protein
MKPDAAAFLREAVKRHEWGSLELKTQRSVYGSWAIISHLTDPPTVLYCAKTHGHLRPFARYVRENDGDLPSCLDIPTGRIPPEPLWRAQGPSLFRPEGKKEKARGVRSPNSP